MSSKINQIVIWKRRLIHIWDSWSVNKWDSWSVNKFLSQPYALRMKEKKILSKCYAHVQFSGWNFCCLRRKENERTKRSLPKLIIQLGSHTRTRYKKKNWFRSMFFAKCMSGASGYKIFCFVEILRNWHPKTDCMLEK